MVVGSGTSDPKAGRRGRGHWGTVDLGAVSHPSLGLPPRDLAAGFPDGAARLRANASRLATRALEIAIAADPTVRTRYDELGLRRLLHDAEVYLERVALSVAGDDTYHARHWAETVAPLYRRRHVPMDDLVAIGEGIRRAIESALTPAERASADRAIDEANRVFRDMRRIAGDARKRNRLLSALYKGG
jgi:hypothetical protein